MTRDYALKLLKSILGMSPKSGEAKAIETIPTIPAIPNYPIQMPINRDNIIIEEMEKRKKILEDLEMRKGKKHSGGIFDTIYRSRVGRENYLRDLENQ
jgi:hypothetical protein